jgi:vacuolar-type H+-ATPase subunit H
MDYLDTLEDLIENTKTNPFSNKISIEKDRIFDLISEMRMNLPHEMKQAQRIIDDHDKIIGDAQNKAASILREGENRAKEMLGDHALCKQAEEKAREILDEAKQDAREMRLGAYEYADGLLAKAETTLREAMDHFTAQFRAIEDSVSETIDIIYENRQELQNSRG